MATSGVLEYNQPFKYPNFSPAALKNDHLAGNCIISIVLLSEVKFLKSQKPEKRKKKRKRKKGGKREEENCFRIRESEPSEREARKNRSRKNAFAEVLLGGQKFG